MSAVEGRCATNAFLGVFWWEEEITTLESSANTPFVKGGRSEVGWTSIGDSCMSCAPELDAIDKVGEYVGEGREKGRIFGTDVDGVEPDTGESRGESEGESRSIGERLRSFFSS